MNIELIRCNSINHGGLRGRNVSYIVVHYTGVAGDTARNNCKYFARADTGKTSAHYFVDEKEVLQSVPDEYIAYHCGGYTYFHDECRNGNSIGVEICTKHDGSAYTFHPEAVVRAQELIRQLMEKYDVPAENVVRHYDVTHKLCPAPFCGEGLPLWEEFKGGLVMYKTIENVPDWAKPTVEKLVEKEYLQGDLNGALNLTNDMTRVLVVLDRAGVFEK